MSKIDRNARGRIQILYDKFFTNPIYITDTNLLRSTHMEYDDDIKDYDPNSFGLVYFAQLKKQKTLDLVIEPNQNSRPDLISFDLYGDTDYWWILSHLNNLERWEDFRSGLRIQVLTKPVLDSFLANNIIFRRNSPSIT